MKNKLFILFLVLILPSGAVYSQGVVRKAYYDVEKTVLKEMFYVKDTIENMLSGPYVSYFHSGKVKSEGAYYGNLATGDWIYYYENGRIRNSGSFYRGKTIGIWTYYFENGNIRSEGILADNEKVGLWTFYYEDGNLKSKGEFIDGERDGTWMFYYEGSTLKATANFKRGTGIYKEYYLSGTIKMEGLNKAGKSDSLWTYYYETGEKLAEGYYKNGLKAGPWKYFYKNGVVSANGGYDQGQTIGNWLYYYENGAKSAEGIQKKSLKDGYWKMFYETGETKGIGEMNEGTGEYKEYYISGQLKLKGQFKNDLNEGHWIYFDEEGNAEGEAEFTNGVGEYSGYYISGELKMSGKISGGRRIGEWILYKKNGEIAGKYHPVYRDENPIYTTEKDLTSGSFKEYEKPEYRYRNSKSRFFTPVINEYKGVIISTNPVFSLIGFFPFSVEYYIQERLGHELSYAYLRSPFYSSLASMKPNEVFGEGHSLQLKQKYYSPDEKFGMFYIGQLIGVDHRVFSSNALINTSTTELVSSNETSIYYGLMVGNRLIRHPGNAGVTVDVFVGISAGKHFYKTNYSNPDYDQVFKDINKSNFYIYPVFGLNIGYLGFKKVKNIPVPSRK